MGRRINCAKTYPVKSPQGATILLYGHDEGVTLIWRGGKRFKLKQEGQAKKSQTQQQNGANDDAVMIIDSEEDEPGTTKQGDAKSEDKPEFEAEPEEGPYPEIVQSVDLKTGSSVLDIAVLPMTPCSSSDASWGGAAILTQKMVFAVACGDKKDRVFTIPLTPPSPQDKGRSQAAKAKAGDGTWGESVAVLGGQAKLTDGIAITLASQPSKTKSTNVIVVTHSREASGTLRLWEVPLEAKTKSKGDLQPFQTEYLPRPLSSIAFNPTHMTQILAVSPSQGVRIYDYAISSVPGTETTGPYPTEGSWLLTLYQPFSRPSAARKPLLDAAWIAHGRAVFALLADGMWGIWDVDGVSPLSSGSAMSNRLRSGVRGAALTAFSASGYVEGTSTLRAAAPQANESSSSGKFAPMTPHTRRQATASLGSTLSVDRLSGVRGGITVYGMPTSGSALPDECVAMWLGGLDHVCLIPAVMRFWEVQARKETAEGVDPFSGHAQPTKMHKISNLAAGLLGERCSGVTLMSDAKSGSAEGILPVDVVIQGESRLVVARQSDSGGDLGSGGVLKRRLFSKGERSNAIVVHGSSRRTGSKNYDLSTTQPGSLRRPSAQKVSFGGEDEQSSNKGAAIQGRGRVGFDFADTLDAAADVSDDLTTRNVEVEMLDIMDIDKALDGLDGGRGGSRKKVFFEDH